MLVLSLQSSRSAALPLKIPQPAHLSIKLSAICQVWLCRAPPAHRASPMAVQPLCQPAALRAGDFNKPEPLSASQEKKDLLYQTGVLLVSSEPSCWGFSVTTCIFATGLLGAAGPTKGCLHTNTTWGAASKTPQAFLFPSLHSCFLHAANTAFTRTYLSNKWGQTLATVNWSRSRGIKKSKLITTPEVLVSNATWKTPEIPLIMKLMK